MARRGLILAPRRSPVCPPIALPYVQPVARGTFRGFSPGAWSGRGSASSSASARVGGTAALTPASIFPFPDFRSRTFPFLLALPVILLRGSFPRRSFGLDTSRATPFFSFLLSPCRSAAASLFAPSARLDKRVCPLPRLRGFIPAPSYPSAAAQAWSAYPCPARLSGFLFLFRRRFLLDFFLLVYPVEHSI